MIQSNLISFRLNNKTNKTTFWINPDKKGLILKIIDIIEQNVNN